MDAPGTLDDYAGEGRHYIVAWCDPGFSGQTGPRIVVARSAGRGGWLRALRRYPGTREPGWDVTWHRSLRAARCGKIER